MPYSAQSIVPSSYFREYSLQRYWLNSVLTAPCSGKLIVIIGSPLGLILSNIFVGFQVERLLSDPNKPDVYFRSVDDAFCLFNNDNEANIISTPLNNIQPALNFTQDNETNYSLPLLDFLVCRTSSGYLPSVYRKPNLTVFIPAGTPFVP